MYLRRGESQQGEKYCKCAGRAAKSEQFLFSTTNRGQKTLFESIYFEEGTRARVKGRRDGKYENRSCVKGIKKIGHHTTPFSSHKNCPQVALEGMGFHCSS